MPLPAIGAWAVPAGISLAKSLFSRGRKTRRPTELMSYYDRQAREGIYSPTARSVIMGTAGAKMGNFAQQEVADIRGRLSASGMGNSIAGTRALSEPGMMRMRSLGDISRRLTAENEMSKMEGARSLAELQGNYAQARSDDRTNRWNQVVGGIADAASAGYNAYQNKDAPPTAMAQGKYAVQFPESFGRMTKADAYAWTVNSGHNWDDIEPIWQQMQDDAEMEAIVGGGSMRSFEGMVMKPISSAFQYPSFKTSFER
jgi:hypothetical protein